MTSTSVLLVGLAVAGFVPRDELVRRGYEPLPDARWLEELERDREAAILGVVLPSLTLTDPSPLALDFEWLDYDRSALYPEPTRVFEIDLKLRQGSTQWDEVLGPGYSYKDSYDKWFGPPRPLHALR